MFGRVAARSLHSTASRLAHYTSPHLQGGTPYFPHGSKKVVGTFVTLCIVGGTGAVALAVKLNSAKQGLERKRLYF
eukprot:CAMPEP_0113879334 /NCGR_PEP_ID=MMETSP0780_2-20120614/7182_1 /TAXON_ID=652834 /ORGANISM="Palpitomonas bilix" /LENGTH=75 /DNA_ID=CAMNT_0000865907 /DNA_START=99 /DNA_END=326 /DNA_ORIENTATION=- /assembly_acc=CAM_ASM_000599